VGGGVLPSRKEDAEIAEKGWEVAEGKKRNRAQRLNPPAATLEITFWRRKPAVLLGIGRGKEKNWAKKEREKPECLMLLYKRYSPSWLG